VKLRKEHLAIVQREETHKVFVIVMTYYDIILSHLLDEGYAETPEAAEVNYGKYE
jgi:hypothetical protein